jgi:hypothetical protein
MYFSHGAVCLPSGLKVEDGAYDIVLFRLRQVVVKGQTKEPLV